MTDSPAPPAPDPEPRPEPASPAAGSGWAVPPASPGGEPPRPEPSTTGWVVPPAAPARTPSPFRSAATRARWVVWLLMANVAVLIVSVGIALWGKSTISGYEAGDLDIADLNQFDALFASIGLVGIAVYIPTVIAWLAWSSRTVDNEDALGIGPSKYTPRMAIAWWFLPFANLIVPYWVHRDIYDRYHRGVRVGAGIVVLWWIVWIVDNIFGNLVGRYWLAAETFPALQTGLTLYVSSDLLTAVSAIIAILLVQRIQRRADVLAASMAERAAAPPALAPSPEPGEPAA